MQLKSILCFSFRKTHKCIAIEINLLFIVVIPKSDDILCFSSIHSCGLNIYKIAFFIRKV